MPIIRKATPANSDFPVAEAAGEIIGILNIKDGARQAQHHAGGIGHVGLTGLAQPGQRQPADSQ